MALRELIMLGGLGWSLYEKYKEKNDQAEQATKQQQAVEDLVQAEATLQQLAQQEALYEATMAEIEKSKTTVYDLFNFGVVARVSSISDSLWSGNVDIIFYNKTKYTYYIQSVYCAVRFFGYELPYMCYNASGSFMLAPGKSITVPLNGFVNYNVWAGLNDERKIVANKIRLEEDVITDYKAGGVKSYKNAEKNEYPLDCSFVFTAEKSGYSDTKRLFKVKDFPQSQDGINYTNSVLRYVGAQTEGLARPQANENGKMRYNLNGTNKYNELIKQYKDLVFSGEDA